MLGPNVNSCQLMANMWFPLSYAPFLSFFVFFFSSAEDRAQALKHARQALYH